MNSLNSNFLAVWSFDDFNALTKQYLEKRELERFSGSLEQFQDTSEKLHSKILRSLEKKLPSLLTPQKAALTFLIYDFYFDELLNYYAENIQTATEEIILDFSFYTGLRKIPLSLNDKIEILPTIRLLYKILAKNNIVNPFVADFVDYITSFQDFYRTLALGSAGQSFFWDVKQDWLSSYYSFLDDHFLFFDLIPDNLETREYVGLLENEFVRQVEKLIFLERRSWFSEHNLSNKDFESLKRQDKESFRYKMKLFVIKWYTSPQESLQGLTREQALILERKFADEQSQKDEDSDTDDKKY